jgi:hypothetical protein
MGIVLIILGILSLVKRDWMWTLTRIGNEMDGQVSRRSEPWEIKTVVGGVLLIGARDHPHADPERPGSDRYPTPSVPGSLRSGSSTLAARISVTSPPDPLRRPDIRTHPAWCHASGATGVT